MFAIRLIPKNPDTRPTIVDVVRTRSWEYLEMIPADEQNFIPGEHVFQPKGTQMTVHFVDDFISEVKYFILKGEDLDQLAAVADEIRNALPTYSDDEILELYPSAKSGEERLRAICLTGIGSFGDFNDKVFDIFRSAFAASEPQVRLAAIDMSAYTGWPEMIDLIIPLRDNDPDEWVKKSAANMVQAMEDAEKANEEEKPSKKSDSKKKKK
jgi:hypothetical protein